MLKLKMDMTNDGVSKDELKRRINSCLILCPLLIFELELDKAETHLNTSISVLEEDKSRKQSDFNKLYTLKECEDLISKCKIWLSWIYLLKVPDAILGVRQYHLKSASGYMDGKNRA